MILSRWKINLKRISKTFEFKLTNKILIFKIIINLRTNKI